MIESKDDGGSRCPVVITKTIFAENFVVGARSGDTGVLLKSGHSGAFIRLEDGRQIYAWRNEYQLLI